MGAAMLLALALAHPALAYDYDPPGPTAWEYAHTGTGVETLAIADFNADGLPDLTWGLSEGSAVVALGQAGAAPSDAVGRAVPDTSFDTVAAGDVNGDGFDDVVVAGFQGGPSMFLGWMAGDAAGVAAAVADLGPAGTGALVGLGDVDGDGVADVLAGVGVWLGSSSGPELATDLPARDLNLTRAFAAGDVTGDGRDDVLLSDVVEVGYYGNRTGPLELFAGSVDGVEAAPTWSFDDGSGGGAFAAVSADLTGDGAPDLAVLSFQFSDALASGNLLALADADSSPAIVGSLPVTSDEPFPVLASLGDVDGDGHDDVALADDDTTTLLTGDPAGFGASLASFAIRRTDASGIARGDLDDDGIADLVVASTVLEESGIETAGNGGAVALWGSRSSATSPGDTGEPADPPTGGGDPAGTRAGDGGGCGCDSEGRGAPWLLLVGLAAVRSRKPPRTSLAALSHPPPPDSFRRARPRDSRYPGR